MKKLLTTLLTIFISYASYADESNFSFMIGDTTINVRTPSGFYESSYINSEVLDIVKMLYPPEVYDIHAVLIPADYDTSPSSRSIILASLKEIDVLDLSKQDFINIKDEIHVFFDLSRSIFFENSKVIDYKKTHIWLKSFSLHCRMSERKLIVDPKDIRRKF